MLLLDMTVDESSSRTAVCLIKKGEGNDDDKNGSSNSFAGNSVDPTCTTVTNDTVHVKQENVINESCTSTATATVNATDKSITIPASSNTICGAETISTKKESTDTKEKKGSSLLMLLSSSSTIPSVVNASAIPAKGKEGTVSGTAPSPSTTARTTKATKMDDPDPDDFIAQIAAKSNLQASARSCDSASTSPHNRAMADGDEDPAQASTCSGSSSNINNKATPTPTPTPPIKIIPEQTMIISQYQHQQRRPVIVSASMSHNYIPPRLYKSLSHHTRSNRRKYTNDRNLLLYGSGSGSNADGSGSANNKIDASDRQKMKVHLFQCVGLECDDNGELRRDQYKCIEEDDDDDDNNIPIDDDAINKKKQQKTIGDNRNVVNNNNDVVVAANKILRQPPICCWTLEQHRSFTTAIFEIGMKNCSPSIIMENMRKQPQYITRERTKSHLQKYRQTKERSKTQFLKEYNAFFESTEQARKHLGCNTLPATASNQSRSKNEQSMCSIIKDAKESISKVVLTAALKGRKPSKLLGGKAAALLSFSVMNDFSTDHGPDQLQYKAAKLEEFPIMTEAEKQTSVGASLLQVKGLLDNMTDVLLKSRYGINPLSGIKGFKDDSSSSSESPDDEYSDDDGDENDGIGARTKRSLPPITSNRGNKNQNSIAITAVGANRKRPYGTAISVGSSSHPMYEAPSTAYPASTYAPPPPPQAYVLQHATSSSFYVSGPPQSSTHLLPPTVPAGYAPPKYHHHPPLNYAHDPRLNSCQQLSGTSYPGGPPPQASNYPGVHSTAYSQQYYDGSATNEYSTHSTASTSAITANTGDLYQQQQLYLAGSATGNETQQQQQQYQQSLVYSNEGYDHGLSYDRGNTHSKHEQEMNYSVQKTALSIDTAAASSRRNNIMADSFDFMERVAKVSSPTKKSKRPATSPIQSRKQKRSNLSLSSSATVSSSTYGNNNNPSADRLVGHNADVMSSSSSSKHMRSHPRPKKRHQSQQKQSKNLPYLDASTVRVDDGTSDGVRHNISSEMYTTDNFDGTQANLYSEGEGSNFVPSPYESSLVQLSGKNDIDNNKNSQLWGDPTTNYMDNCFNTDHQIQASQEGTGSFEQQQQPSHNPNRRTIYSPDQHSHLGYDDAIDGQNVEDDGYSMDPSSQFPTSSSAAKSSERYFFGE